LFKAPVFKLVVFWEKLNTWYSHVCSTYLHTLYYYVFLKRVWHAKTLFLLGLFCATFTFRLCFGPAWNPYHPKKQKPVFGEKQGNTLNLSFKEFFLLSLLCTGEQQLKAQASSDSAQTAKLVLESSYEWKRQLGAITPFTTFDVHPLSRTMWHWWRAKVLNG